MGDCIKENQQRKNQYYQSLYLEKVAALICTPVDQYIVPGRGITVLPDDTFGHFQLNLRRGDISLKLYTHLRSDSEPAKVFINRFMAEMLPRLEEKKRNVVVVNFPGPPRPIG